MENYNLDNKLKSKQVSSINQNGINWRKEEEEDWVLRHKFACFRVLVEKVWKTFEEIQFPMKQLFCVCNPWHKLFDSVFHCHTSSIIWHIKKKELLLLSRKCARMIVCVYVWNISISVRTAKYAYPSYTYIYIHIFICIYTTRPARKRKITNNLPLGSLLCISLSNKARSRKQKKAKDQHRQQKLKK